MTMLTFKEYLKEHLTKRQLATWSKHKMTDKAREDTDHFFGKDNDEVKEELKGSQVEKSEIHKAVERHLGKEISPEEYKSGTTSDRYGRSVKLGKQIKDEKLRNQFASDNTRAGVKSTTGHYVTVVRGTQVAGQTNPEPDEQNPKGHPWAEQSCKNIKTGSNKTYLKHEIKHGTVVVRVHDHTGQEIYRATLQPHHNNLGHVAYALDSEYGLKQPSFTSHAHDVARRLSGEHKGGSLIYTKHPDVYNDNDITTIIHPNLTKEQLDNALESKNDNVRIAAIRHPNATKEHIDKALNNKNPLVREAAMENPNATKEHIDKGINDEDDDVRFVSAQHSNATKEHIDKALDDENYLVRRAAIQNRNATKEHIDKALNDTNYTVRAAAIQHSNVTKEHINKAINDPNQIVSDTAKNIQAKRNM